MMKYTLEWTEKVGEKEFRLFLDADTPIAVVKEYSLRLVQTCMNREAEEAKKAEEAKEQEENQSEEKVEDEQDQDTQKESEEIENGSQNCLGDSQEH